MHKDRLLRLADLLEEDSANPEGIRFDMNYWSRSTHVDLRYDWKPAHSCGTTACAMGLAAISGRFKKEGLSLDLTGVPEMPGGYVGLGAAAELFTISLRDASLLFLPDAYEYSVGAKAERAVALRIRALVAGDPEWPAVGNEAPEL